MTTQNVYQFRATFANLPVATYFFPLAVQDAGVVQVYFTPTTANAYINMDGYDHLSIQFSLTAGANNTLTLTVESDDGVTTTFVWDETLGSYNSCTNTNAATWAAAATTTNGHLHLDDCNGRRYHVKLVVANAGVLSNSGIITIRQTKV